MKLNKRNFVFSSTIGAMLFLTEDAISAQTVPWWSSNEQIRPMDVTAGQPAPGLVGKLTNGEELNLDSWIGKQPIVVIFWATWCPHCVRALPTINSIYDECEAKGIKMVAVSIDETAEKAQGWWNGYKMKPMLAWHKDVKHQYGRIRGTPEVVLIDKSGVIKETIIGSVYRADILRIKDL